MPERRASTVQVTDEDAGSRLRPHRCACHPVGSAARHHRCVSVEVTPSGLWLSASGRLVGASPDRFVGSTKTGEVKCPYSARSAPLRQLPLGPKGFFLGVNGQPGLAAASSLDGHFSPT